MKAPYPQFPGTVREQNEEAFRKVSTMLWMNFKDAPRPNGLKLFVDDDDYMDNLGIYSWNVRTFSDQELLTDPLGRKSWYSAFVNMYYEYLVVFSEEKDSDGNVGLAAWKLDVRQANNELHAKAKLRIHGGADDSGRWQLQLLRETWYLGQCAIAFIGDLRIPMVISLFAERERGMDSRVCHLTRVTQAARPNS